jgi:hypothetical protein
MYVIIKRVKYPDWYNYDAEDNGEGQGGDLHEYEEDYTIYRDEIAALFTNIAMIQSFHF